MTLSFFYYSSAQYVSDYWSMKRRATILVLTLVPAALVFVGVRVALTSSTDETIRIEPKLSEPFDPGPPSMSATDGLREVAISPQDDIASPAIPAAEGYVATKPPSLTLAEERAHFMWLRETSGREDLHQEFLGLQEEFLLACSDEVAKRVGNGEYEKLPESDNGTRELRISPERRHLIDLYSVDDEGLPIRVTLPEGLFPEQYKIRQKLNWLEDLLKRAE